jgi:hypothetical protein
MVELAALGPPYDFLRALRVLCGKKSAFGSVGASPSQMLSITRAVFVTILREIRYCQEFSKIFFESRSFGNKRDMFMRICIKDIDPGQ